MLRIPIAAILGAAFTTGVFWLLWHLVGTEFDVDDVQEATRIDFSRMRRDTEVATLIEPDGPNGRGYLLTNNYRAILDYNCSNFYALSVGLLANAITGR